MDELALATACANGEYSAQRKLYQLYASQMMGVCMRYSSCEADAEDILQDGFIKVYHKINTYAGKGPLGGWIRQVMVNTALQRYRDNKPLQVVSLNEFNSDATDEHEDIFSELNAEDLMKKIQALPAGFRTVFNLFAVEGYKHHEIADQLGISEGTSKSQYSRARALLREMILNDNLSSEREIGK